MPKPRNREDLQELLNPGLTNEPGKFYARGNVVFVNQMTIQRRVVARFFTENDAAKYAVQKNKEKSV